MRRLSLVAALILLAARAAAGESDGAGSQFFESKVRPLLAEHCYRCHSARAPKVKGGLRLDSREGLLQGGESGPALVPGHPEQSRLVEAVRYTSPELQMPPKQRLSDRAGGGPGAVGRDGRPLAGGRRADTAGRGNGRCRDLAAAGGALGMAAGPVDGPAGRQGRRRGCGLPLTGSSWPGSRPSGCDPAPSADRRTTAPAGPLRPDRPAAHARRGRGVRRRRGTRRAGARGRPAARLAALRRAVGPALDGPRPLRRHARQRGRHADPQRLAVSRLRGPRLQRRPAVRPVRPRTHRRRPAGRPRRHPDSGDDESVLGTGFYSGWARASARRSTCGRRRPTASTTRST